MYMRKHGTVLWITFGILLVLVACTQTKKTAMPPAQSMDERERTVFQLSLSDEMKENIRTAYYDWFARAYGYEAEQTQWYWEDTNDGVITQEGYRYYGTFDDCVVWYTFGEDTVSAAFPEAGQGSFYVYRDGEHLSLMRAYQTGLISDADIEQITHRHRSCTLGYRCYGTFDGCTVWFEETQTDEPVQIDVAGVSFRHRTGAVFHAYRDGKDHTLQQAYTLGYLTAADLQTAAQRHYERDLSVFELFLSDEMKETIRSAYYAQFKKNHPEAPEQPPWVWDDTNDGRISYQGRFFYGSFNGSYVWCTVGNATEVTEFTVAGYSFSYGYGADIWVYREGNCYSLQQAYELGLISAEDIGIVARRDRALREDYRWYGEYNGCDAWFVEDKNRLAVSFTLAGVTFDHLCGADFYVHRDGENVTLQQAYERKWLTGEDVAAIAVIHNMCNTYA